MSFLHLLHLDYGLYLIYQGVVRELLLVKRLLLCPTLLNRGSSQRAVLLGQHFLRRAVVLVRRSGQVLGFCIVFLLRKPTGCRLCPDVSRGVDQLIVEILQSYVVLVIAEVLWLKRVNPFEVSKVVQLELVLDSDLLLASLLLLVVACSRQPLQPPLLVDPRVVKVTILTAPVQVEHAEAIHEDTLLDLVV